MKFYFIPWIAFGISLLVTTIVWGTIVSLDSQSNEIEFKLLTQKMVNQIQNRLLVHEQILLAFKGLFLASIEVTPEEFSKFFEIQQINPRFQDIQGIGFIQYVRNEDEKKELMNQLTEYGQDFQIYPDGIREEYFPVVLLEPHDLRNQKAFGYDVYTESARQHAIDQAIKTGQTTITGKIILVQEIDQNVQNGFLMLLPVYQFREDGSFELMGFVYSVFRMNDFIVGTLDENIFQSVGTTIYDGTREPENLFFNSNFVSTFIPEKDFENTYTIEFGQKEWVLDFYGNLPMTMDNNQNNWLLIPVVGYGMSLLLFFTFFLFSKNIQLTKNIAKKEKISIVGELASRFSHDIRNPLSNIQMAIELLQKNSEVKSNPFTKEKIELITKNLDRINHQVNDVLDFIRPQPLNKKVSSLLSCISESVSALNIPKNIKIQLPLEDVLFYGDFHSLQIVFKNLILNAIQAIGKSKGKIIIRVDSDDRYNIIEIEDSGPGFTENKKAEIFEPLITSKQEGTGLGLLSCKNIIENHGGKINVKLNPTRFIIWLPKK